METSQREARKELVSLMTDIDDQIVAVGFEAKELGIEPAQLRTPDGSWPLINLYNAKAMALHAYVMMTKKE